MDKLSEKITQLPITQNCDEFEDVVLVEDIKEIVRAAYFDMPWAILTPLGKKAIEVAFKDNFGFDVNVLTDVTEASQ